MFFETSALNGNNIDKLLDNIAISIYEKNKKDEDQLENATRNSITLDKDDFARVPKKKGDGEGEGKGKKKKIKKFC